MQKTSNLFNGSLLVAGSSIGGGMLALPVVTSVAGFMPSLLLYVLCWLFMTATGLLILEVCLWMHKEANIVSMADRTLGSAGKAFAWFMYLFLFYCLTLAYIVGCGNLLTEFFPNLISDRFAPILFVAIFAPIILLGTRIVGNLNMVMMLALAACFFTFVVIGYRYVDTGLLFQESHWLSSMSALPVAFTAFAYQGIVPTLASYLHYDVKKTRWAILIGSTITLVTYIIWQWLIMGIIPIQGPNGLLEALQNGNTAVHPLKDFLENSWIYVIGQYFAFFALLTSFLGVTLGLFDFLADALKIKKDVKGKAILFSLVYGPPLIFAFTHPHVFLKALDYAGGFGCALLLGVLPILMVWSGRYRLKMPSNEELPGGRLVLILLFIFVVIELVSESIQLFGLRT